MKGWWWNGVAFEACDGVPLSDRGFRYGMSIFESLRIQDSEPQFLDAHLQRLRAACADRKFHCDHEALIALRALFKECGVDGLARIYVTAGDGPVAAEASNCRLFVLIESRPRPSESSWGISVSGEVFTPLFEGMKTGNYWANADALWRAQQNGNREALLFNHLGELVSACAANVFLVHGSRITTPSTACGARAGVIREALMQHLRVDQCSLFMKDVETADEILLTNSWIGLVSVRSVGNQLTRSRDLFLSLQDLFR